MQDKKVIEKRRRALVLALADLAGVTTGEERDRYAAQTMVEADKLAAMRGEPR